MKKSKANALVDIITFFPFLVAAITGVIIWVFLPCGGEFRGIGGAFGQQIFLGIARHTWADVHTYVGLIFIALVAIHLLLHWGYIKRLPRLFQKRQPQEET